MSKKLLTTPKGVAIYPHLNSADTKFKKEGEWRVKLKIEGAEGKLLAQTINAAMKESLTEGQKAANEKAAPKKAKVLKLMDAPWSKDEDGGFVFSFKMKASGIKKDGSAWKRAPAIFDASGEPYKEIPRIGGGSTLRISYEMEKFATPLGAGVSLRLNGVQVITLVEWGANAATHGFENEAGDDDPNPKPVDEDETETKAEPEEKDEF